ncbi:MAG: glutaredoxin family protein [Betaproteobacteria bacterium]|nr:glutaredoxin family protein [Betaproteobacteria bacterium]
MTEQGTGAEAVEAGARLKLLSRTYCHLCHDMERALEPLLAEARADGADLLLEILDVDSDPALEERWGDLVPVLLAGEIELCHYFLDVPKVREYLSRIG